MKVFVGLGNPGTQYQRTRHNVGFLFIDALKEAFSYPEFKGKGKALITEKSISLSPKMTGGLSSDKTILIKPQDFMNRSGPPVNSLTSFYKIPPEDIIVIYDDLDLAPGKMRLKQGGGAGGHNGIKSLMAHIGPNFWRLKVGIGRPPHPDQAPADFVLQNFTTSEKTTLIPLMEKTVDYIDYLWSETPNTFISQVMQPEKK